MFIPDYDVCSLEVIIPFCNGIINSISFLFSHAPFSLSFQKVCKRKAIGNSVPSCSWDSCALQALSEASV